MLKRSAMYAFTFKTSCKDLSYCIITNLNCLKGLFKLLNHNYTAVFSLSINFLTLLYLSIVSNK